MIKNDLEEKKRLLLMSSHEGKLKKQGYLNIAGVDEAGRGPWAGPVVAAACILKNFFFIKGLNDSKKLTASKRQEVYQKLLASKEVIYSIGIVDAKTIDEINVLQATLKAMKQAVESLVLKPDFLLIDGNQLPKTDIPSQALIKGDTLSISIAAASIIAKQTRDNLMIKYHERWPVYKFLEHKGYGTKKHKAALDKYGPCELHRMSFEPLKVKFL